MNNLSISSPIFLILLLLGPMLMITPITVRRYLLLIVNTGLYITYLHNVEETVWILIFVFLPLVYIKLARKWSIPVWLIIIIILSIFCYLDFFEKSSTIKLLGLSYMLFRLIDILILMNSGLIPKIDSIDYFNYLFSFWTIIAGPIQRFNEFKDSFYAEKPLISDEQRLQFQHRAANGLIKILIFGAFFKDISDVALKYYVSYRGNPLELLSNMKCFIAIFYCYPLYLWFNFSGYCDVVIGMGKWAGFTIPENFNKPYLSRNLIEFWNRWHMTLSRWIRDFVYLQLFDFLGSSILSKHIFKAQYLSIFITFILVGIWHGTTKNFVVFGFLQGIGMAGSMYYRDILLKKFGKQRYERYIDNKKIAFIERFICIHYICFTLLFFM